MAVSAGACVFWYDALIMALVVPPTRLLYQNAATFPLGSIRMAGYIRNGAGLSRMRVLGAYALVLLLDGGGWFEDANHSRRRVSAGDLLTVFPDVPHRYGPVAGEGAEPWSEIYVTFAGPIFDLWRAEGLLRPQAAIRRVEAIEYRMRRMEAVVEKTAFDSPVENLRQVCRLQAVLADLNSADQAAGLAGHDRQWLVRACQLLEQQTGGDKIDADRIAVQTGMSYETFRKRFVKLTGATPGSYRVRKRIDRACDLLHRPESTVRSVAAACGFCDEFHFSKRFKQLVGLSPTEFRRRLP
jgi:AraC-like DNA-binding protein